jgi:hypothetical protein
LQTVRGTENIPWLFDTGAQKTCLPVKLFHKNPLGHRPKKIITNRRFVRVGGETLKPGGIFNLPFTWTEKEGRQMKVQNDVIGMKTLNSGAIMGMDLIRKLGLVYRSRPNKLEFEDT